jgi:hypothetical protein
VVAPTGSRDPFWVIEDKHYGASDHVVFISQGIPAVMFITWPDHFYHSSQDTPERLDPTQMKRAAVVGIGAMSLLASAGDEAALKIAGESLARGAERMGAAQKKGVSYLADLPFGLSLPDAYKEARVAVQHQASVEKAVVRSTAILFTDPAAAGRKLAAFDGLIDQRAAALQNELAALFALRAEQQKVAATEPQPTDLDRLAARTRVDPVASAGGMSMFGGGGRGGAGAAQDTPLAAARRKIPSHMTGELAAILRQPRSVLEVRDFLAGEFEPLPLQDVFDYVKALEGAGQVKLVEQPDLPAKGKKPAPKK